MESINLIPIRDSLINIAEEIKQDRNDLYQKLLEICEEIDNLFYENDDYSWPMSKNDFCKNFDLNDSSVRTHMRNHLIEGKDYFIEGMGRTKEYYFEKYGALKIFEHSRSEKGIRYKNKHGSSISPKEEHLYINIIKYALMGFDIPKKQHKVKLDNNKYKNIDLYLERTKLAIECDEHDHYYQESSNELLKREEDISNNLGCRFLRFNPHEPDFNIGEVISVIFHYIANKSINGKDPIRYYQEKRQRSIRRGICVPKLSTELDLTDMPD
jgi:very-short-patch-repair endonuclease